MSSTSSERQPTTFHKGLIAFMVLASLVMAVICFSTGDGAHGAVMAVCAVGFVVLELVYRNVILPRVNR